MSKVQVDTIVDKDDISAPTFSKGAIVTGVCTATTFVGALTGNADTATTATTTSGNAGGLTGTPSITVNNAVVTSTTVGSAVTANSDGVIITGIATVVGDISQRGSTLDVAADIRHVGDTDTKISFTDNNIALDTAGSTALNIDSSGHVSVGYAGNSLYFQNGFNDSNSRILNGGATNNSDFRFHTRNSGTDGERLRIGSAGEIGIAGANYGTSGQVLTSGGSGAAVSWADAGGGAWELIQNTDMGSDYGSETFTYTGFTTAYSEYRVNVNQVGYVGGSAKKLYCRVYLNGTLHDAGGSGNGYYSKYAYTDYTTGGQTTGGALETTWWQFQGNSSNNYWQGSITIPQQPDIANFAKSSKVKAEWLSGSYYIPYDVVDCLNVSGGSTLKQITGIKLSNGTDTTNLAFGRIQIYGLKSS